MQNIISKGQVFPGDSNPYDADTDLLYNAFVVACDLLCGTLKLCRYIQELHTTIQGWRDSLELISNQLNNPDPEILNEYFAKADSDIVHNIFELMAQEISPSGKFNIWVDNQDAAGWCVQDAVECYIIDVDKNSEEERFLRGLGITGPVEGDAI
ncbi:hypothetical protein N7510_002587 [Penicillium lagena]|uniref:uncharacterized protein n=1 Tax=Penicillium lagena TaxID=94218 RepID=UPI002540B305|nr:uncharacterized protein N7510_002587 [Penicillium lagena]KAJ5626278.1 hypothetical protein N7510_002587 [Penicillium lagena]